MENNLEAKHICKFCGKSFTNVRALGGHVRGHIMALKSSKELEKIDGIQMGFKDHKSINIDMRVNPKKSWWVSSNAKQEGAFCDQCGKGFKSLKALFGHMRLHSKRKVRLEKEDKKKPNTTQKKKTIERRYKINTKCLNSSSFSNLSTSCSSMIMSNVDEGLDDIAACLLMLAKGGFYSNPELVSDDDSVKMDPNFPIECAQKTTNYDDNDDKGVIEGVAISEPGLNSCDLGSGYVSVRKEITELHSFDCTTVKFGPNNGGMEKPIFENVQEAELYDTEIREEIVGDANKVDHVFDIMNSRTYQKHMCDDCFDSDPTFSRFRSLETTICVKDNTETSILLCDEADSEAKLGIKNKKKKQIKHQCVVCLKAFATGQALGGHMRAHVVHVSSGSKDKADLALTDNAQQVMV